MCLEPACKFARPWPVPGIRFAVITVQAHQDSPHTCSLLSYYTSTLGVPARDSFAPLPGG